MRAAVFDAFNDPLRIATRPDPAPAPGEVLIRTRSCGICGSDLHLAAGESGLVVEPGCIFGHEFAGDVVARGTGVRDFAIGDRVVVLPVLGCGSCRACLGGEFPRCAQAQYMGAGVVPGAYAEYVRAPAGNTLRLPDSMTYDDGALIEPLAVGLRGVWRAQMKLADRALVLGTGPIGMAAIFWARRMGAERLVASAPSRRREAIAQRMGADTFLPYDTDLPAAATNALGGPPEVVFECTGHPGAIARALQCVAIGGTVVVLGFCGRPDDTAPALAVFKDVTMQFSVAYDLRTYRQAIATLAAGATEPRAMITEHVDLDGLPTAFTALRERSAHCKVMIHP
ncbi:MAG: alcohol dehydrogenase catalytic domain-containing protein [Steroidobacteraceae bacterium]